MTQEEESSNVIEREVSLCFRKMANSSSATSSGSRAFRPMEEQLQQLKKAIRLAFPGSLKTAEKECKMMDVEVRKIIASQQRRLEEKIALNIVFKMEGERCEQKLEQLEKETEGRSVNRKAKKEIKNLKETHAKCCKWLFLWNGASSWMMEDVMEETGDMENVMESLKQLKEENKKIKSQMKDLW